LSGQRASGERSGNITAAMQSLIRASTDMTTDTKMATMLNTCAAWGKQDKMGE